MQSKVVAVQSNPSTITQLKVVAMQSNPRIVMQSKVVAVQSNPSTKPLQGGSNNREFTVLDATHMPA
eukprot:scaffold1618_cov80-Skeletonema_dohrnii-CCMP3373.AAC.2